MLFVRQRDGRILEANRAAEHVYGYPRDELLRLSIHDLRAEETTDLTGDQMATAASHGILFETLHRRRDGSIFPVEVSSRGTYDDSGRGRAAERRARHHETPSGRGGPCARARAATAGSST